MDIRDRMAQGAPQRSNPNVEQDVIFRPAPFFVVGAQRSGTTMLRLMLDSHPQLLVPFESGFIVDFYRRLHSYGNLSLRQNAARLLQDISESPLVRKGGLLSNLEEILAHPVQAYSDLISRIFESLGLAAGKERWGDKSPNYVTDIDVLRAIFPDCQVVHIVRDGRDVALSNRNVEWGIRSLPKAAADWRWKTTIAHKVGSILRDDYLLVRYEDLVLEPERTLRSITTFLNVPYSSAMLRYHETATERMPAESMRWHRNSVRPPDPSLLDQWRRRMSRADRVIFEQCAQDALQTFGYELENSRSTLGSRLKTLYFATFQPF